MHLYQGPEFKMHVKFANLLMVIFVTFMWGSVLPILFPIAVLTLSMTYIKERLMIYYSY